MNESNVDKNHNYNAYVEEDINEMIEKLANYPDNKSESTSAIHRGFRQNPVSDRVEQVSVIELNSPDEDYVPFYYLIQKIAENIETISTDNKKQIKKINKLHHDLLNINAGLVSIDRNLYKLNLIKLYENQLISEDEMIDKYARCVGDDIE